VTGDVQAFLTARVLRLHPGRRVATVKLRSVGRGRSYASAYSGAAPSEQLCAVVDPFTSRRLGRVVKVDPVAGGGAELSLIIGDDRAWQALAAGSAKVDVLVSFEGASGADPYGGRPVRVEVG
jgi:hypothetical protein